MKTIIAATDFSPAARDAADYAAALARVFNARLLLIHGIVLPIAPMDASVVVVEPTLRLIQDQEAAMNKEIERLGATFTVSMEGFVKPGDITSELLDAAKAYDADLIIMGMKGSGNTSKLFGNTVTTTLRRSKIAVLAIPQGTIYEPLVNINMAADFNNNTKDYCYDVLFEIAGRYQSKVNILHVQKSSEMTADEIAGKMRLNLVLEGLRHEFFTATGNDVEKCITEFNEAHPAGMLVMVAHKHNLLQRLFGEVHTRSMSFFTNIPLLVLEDK